MKLYLASPLGFSEAGRHFYSEVLIPRLAACGCAILDPWTLTDAAKVKAVTEMPYGAGRRDAWRTLSSEIGRNNAEAIAACEVLLAVLDGSDVDSGTAAEIGFAFALKKRIVGYRSDFRLAGDNEGSVVNLQVEYFIRESGGTIVSDLEAIPAALGACRS
ncbi:MAG TPA: nucleoside 2-deoxyribosyltransferase [Rhizomicrobium sp.]|nr:nucleoside 2-deoxyribosyltransferase [Rhizomicrobium sp.]